MGAALEVVTYPVDLTLAEVKAQFAEDQADDRVRNGTEYSGSIGMLRGLKAVPMQFATYKEAEDFIADKQEKWGAALAVKGVDRGGQPAWLVGGWCAE